MGAAHEALSASGGLTWNSAAANLREPLDAHEEAASSSSLWPSVQEARLWAQDLYPVFARLVLTSGDGEEGGYSLRGAREAGLIPILVAGVRSSGLVYHRPPLAADSPSTSDQAGAPPPAFPGPHRAEIAANVAAALKTLACGLLRKVRTWDWRVLPMDEVIADREGATAAGSVPLLVAALHDEFGPAPPPPPRGRPPAGVPTHRGAASEASSPRRHNTPFASGGFSSGAFSSGSFSPPTLLGGGGEGGADSLPHNEAEAVALVARARAGDAAAARPLAEFRRALFTSLSRRAYAAECLDMLGMQVRGPERTIYEANYIHSMFIYCIR